MVISNNSCCKHTSIVVAMTETTIVVLTVVGTVIMIEVIMVLMTGMNIVDMEIAIVMSTVVEVRIVSDLVEGVRNEVIVSTMTVAVTSAAPVSNSTSIGLLQLHAEEWKGKSRYRCMNLVGCSMYRARKLSEAASKIGIRVD